MSIMTSINNVEKKYENEKYEMMKKKEIMK